MSSDAIVLLKEDYKEIRGLFRTFQQTGEDASTRQGQIADSILEALTVHTYLENEVMYPRVRELLPDLGEDLLESYEEHDVAAWNRSLSGLSLGRKKLQELGAHDRTQEDGSPTSSLAERDEEDHRRVDQVTAHR